MKAVLVWGTVIAVLLLPTPTFGIPAALAGGGVPKDSPSPTSEHRLARASAGADLGPALVESVDRAGPVEQSVPTNAPIPPPRWEPLSTPTAPDHRVAAAMAFDPLSNESILFGGFVGAPTASPSKETWSFSALGWRNLTTTLSTSPPAMQGASMAADPADGYLLLFGGQFTNGSLSNQSWSFSGGQWHALITPVAPPPRIHAAMSWDSTAHEVILFGGEGGSPSYLNDTWAFASGAWTQLSPSTPPAARGNAAVSDDPLASGIVLFGGRTAPSSVPFADTEVFASGQWTALATPARPSARASSVMIYDPTFAAVLLFGGYNGSVSNLYFNDTWRFNASGWALTPFASAPAPRGTGDFVFDRNLGLPILYGGAGTSADLGDTWIFDSPSLDAYSGRTAGVAPFNYTANVTTRGGWAPYVVAWSFGDGSSGSGTTIRHTYRQSGNFQLNISLQDSFGIGQSPGISYVVNVAAPPAKPLHVSIVADRSNGPEPLRVNLSANVTGGSEGYTYSWTFGDSASSTLAAPSHVYTSVGSWNITVTVSDSLGDRSSNSTIVVVSASPTTPSTGCSSAWCTLEGVPAYLWAIVAAAVAAAVTVPIWATRRRGKGPSSSSVVGTTRGSNAPAGRSEADPPTPSTASRSIEAHPRLPGPESAPPAPASPPPEPEPPLSNLILTHLYRLGRPPVNEPHPLGFAQPGLADALGRPQSAFARSLQRLEASGLVRSQLAHVRGGRRRLKVYELTPSGESAARKLLAESDSPA